MSRVGKQPIPLPADVKVTLADGKIRVEGKKGKLELTFHPNIQVKHDIGPNRSP
jgi:large subunit ribosomal protein L6